MVPSIDHSFRKYRGVGYQIEVKNPNGVCKGVKSVTVDGKKVAGNVIPYEADKKTVKVENDLLLPFRFSLVIYGATTDPDVAGHIARVGISLFEREATRAHEYHQ
jgi:hypothetical protein